MSERYRASERRRFEISRDPFSRERAVLLKQLYLELREQFPDVRIGFTLFGSLSKGKVLNAETAKTSDVDVHVFIDEHDLKKRGETLPSNDPFERLRRDLDIGAQQVRRQFSGDEMPMPVYHAGDPIDRYCSTMITHATRSRLSVPTSCAPQVHMIALNVEGDRTRNDIFSRAMEAFLYNSMKEGVKNRGLGASFLGAPPMPLDIAAPWFLDIGGGMREYRQEFLRQIQGYPQYWEPIVAAMDAVERESNQLVSPTGRPFPRTYAEAVKYYYKA
ncbi:MAG: nucleotidyltransferase domain-containing protein [Candidatus Kerfeldbacteria bacterium]|nr:nucleotidyltransferase domain-containing protein [Candidatus Kerfeldbacteria bacterium]